jgi:hypothetical protein
LAYGFIGSRLDMIEGSLRNMKYDDAATAQRPRGIAKELRAVWGLVNEAIR